MFGEKDTLARFLGENRVLIVADQNVVLHGNGLGTRIGAYVTEHKLKLAASPVVISGGERIKMDGFIGVTRVVEAIYAAEMGPEDVVLALGGGAFLDAVGWAVAQVRDAVKFIRVPTTPAAMLGIALADTAALNTAEMKDAFIVSSVPTAVLLDPSLASTVLDGVWRAGISEVVRLVADRRPEMLDELAPLAEAYQNRDIAALAELTKRMLEIRREEEPSELGLQAASELEPKSGWKLPYGYAVAIGTIIELEEPLRGKVHAILKSAGAMDGARHSKHILPPELADFW